MTKNEIKSAIQVVESRDFGDYPLSFYERQAIENLVVAAERYMQIIAELLTEVKEQKELVK